MPSYGMSNATGAVGAGGDPSAVDGFPLPPVCTVAPVVTGSAALGSTLTTNDGTFVGTGLTAATRQWYRGTASIVGATATTYVTVTADYGLAVSCITQRMNASGAAASGQSNAITVTATAPVNTVAGVLSGATPPGSTLTCTSGTWTGTATITFTYQFKADGANLGSPGGNTYVTQAGDLGKTITCVPIGTNITGSVNGTASNGIVVANAAYAKWDAALPGDSTLSNSDRTSTFPGLGGATPISCQATVGQTTGKFYMEFFCETGFVQGDVGLARGGVTQAANPFLAYDATCGLQERGYRSLDGSADASGAATWVYTAGDVVAFVWDITGATATHYRNNVLIGTFPITTHGSGLYYLANGPRSAASASIVTICTNPANMAYPARLASTGSSEWKA